MQCLRFQVLRKTQYNSPDSRVDDLSKYQIASIILGRSHQRRLCVLNSKSKKPCTQDTSFHPLLLPSRSLSRESRSPNHRLTLPPRPPARSPPTPRPAVEVTQDAANIAVEEAGAVNAAKAAGVATSTEAEAADLAAEDTSSVAADMIEAKEATEAAAKEAKTDAMLDESEE
jgi:hypothetical protein